MQQLVLLFNFVINTSGLMLSLLWINCIKNILRKTLIISQWLQNVHIILVYTNVLTHVRGNQVPGENPHVWLGHTCWSRISNLGCSIESWKHYLWSHKVLFPQQSFNVQINYSTSSRLYCTMLKRWTGMNLIKH